MLENQFCRIELIILLPVKIRHAGHSPPEDGCGHARKLGSAMNRADTAHRARRNDIGNCVKGITLDGWIDIGWSGAHYPVAARSLSRHAPSQPGQAIESASSVKLAIWVEAPRVGWQSPISWNATE